MWAEPGVVYTVFLSNNMIVSHQQAIKQYGLAQYLFRLTESNIQTLKLAAGASSWVPKRYYPLSVFSSHSSSEFYTPPIYQWEVRTVLYPVGTLDGVYIRLELFE